MVQALGMAGVAVSLWTGGPPLLAYGLAVLASTAMTTTRPALFAALPALARDAEQLTAANVVAGWAENLGVVLSALVASLFLGLGQIGTLFAVCAVLVAGAAVLVAPVRVTGIALADADRPASRFTTLLAGAREVAGRPRPRLLVSLLTAQYVVVGSLDVLFVVIAIQVLGRGQVWVGYLNAAYGAGAVAAGLLTAHLLGRRLGRALVTSLLALSAGLILTAFTSALGLVVTLIAVAGGGRAVLAVSANTLLQRVVPAQLVGRVFGIVEGLSMAGLAAGSLLTPLLVGFGGARLALIAVGCLAAGHRGVRAADPAPGGPGPGRARDRGSAAALAAALRGSARPGAGNPGRRAGADRRGPGPGAHPAGRGRRPVLRHRRR